MLSSKKLETKIKILATLFALLLNIMPSTVVMAQEQDSSQAVSAVPVETDIQTEQLPFLRSEKSILVSEDAVNSDQDIIEPSPDTPLPTSITTTETQPFSNNEDKKFPAVKYKFDVDQNTGALIYSHPLDIPAGRNNLQPDLSLVYNSQNRDLLNFAGYGWSLNIPTITRMTKSGSYQMYGRAEFISDVGGELAPISIDGQEMGVYYSKVDNGDFLKMEYLSDYSWKITDKNGTIYTFGNNAIAREYRPSSPDLIYRWWLEEVRDTNNNYIKYEYYKDQGQVYPNKIKYTGNGTNDGIYEVEFIRENRDDAQDSDVPWFVIKNNYRLAEIQIKINGAIEKKYNFTYALGDNYRRSLLDKITSSGKDLSGQFVSKSEIEDLQYHSYNDWATTTFDPPLPFASTTIYDLSDLGVQIVDVNGDGLADMLKGKNGNRHVYINDGNNWVLDNSWTWPVDFIGSGDNIDMGIRMADVNGDGLVDILQGLDVDWVANTRKIYINNGHGWTYDPTYVLPVSFTNQHDGGAGLFSQDLGIRLADVNGDGLVDILPSGYINNGHGWTIDSAYVAPFAFTDSYRDTGGRLVDVNGDGLTDILKGLEIPNMYPDKRVYINNGHGWTLDSTYSLPLSFSCDYEMTDCGTRIADINGDGLPDLLYARVNETTKVYINNGHGWTLSTAFSIPWHFIGPGGVDSCVRFQDINGDGMDDYIHGQEADDQRDALINNTNDDVLIGLSDLTGLNINFQYKQAAKYLNNDSTLANPKLYNPIITVSQIDLQTGDGTHQITDYQYSGGEFYYASSTEKKFAGFAQVEKTQGSKKTITYFHQGNSTNSALGEQTDSYYKIGRPYRTEVYDNSSLKSVNVTHWQDYDLGNNRKFVYDAQTVNTTLDTTPVSIAKTKTYDFTNGNLLTENDLGQVQANYNTGEITDTLSVDNKQSDYEYAVNTIKNILAAPKNKEISNAVESKDQDLYYDNLALGEVEKVNLTKEDYKVDSVKVQRTFNSYGLVATETDPKNATTTISYDSYNMYPSSATNPLNQVTYTEYNLRNGQVATSTDPNGLVTVNTFDAFGRISKIQMSDPNSPSNLLTKQEIIYQDNNFPNYKESKNYFTSTQYQQSREYYDGLGRVIQKKAKLANNNYSTVDISYDALGRVERESLPYETATLDYTAKDLSKPAKTYTYDALDRVLTETTPVGATTYEYDGLTTKIFDANNHRKDLVKDASGNLIQVKEYLGSNIYTTNYEYTLTNKLKKITDSAGNVRNFSYDALDNLIWQDMVHTPSTSNPAKIQYTYDKNGNVLTETSFKNDAISYTYDNLNRVLNEKLSGVNKISYTYDAGQYNKGQLVSADYGSGNSKAYDYDIWGQIKTATTTIAGEAYILKYEYNLAGALSKVIYPNNYQVIYGFDASGQVNSVSLDKGQGPSTIASNIEYNQNGQMTHLERANGVITDYTYDPAQAFRLTRILSANVTSTLQDINYTYDSVGNILTIVDNANTDLQKSASYIYDDLNRLLSATVSYTNHPDKNYTQSFTYDSIGNMTSNSDLGTLNYANSQPHQLSSYGTRTFTYDLAGNMKTNKVNKFFWDWRNRLANTYDIASENNTYYKYDHNNQRFIKYTEDYIYYPPDPEVPTEELSIPDLPRSVTSLNNLESINQESTIDGAGYWEWQVVSQDKYIDKYFEENLNEQTKSHVYLNDIKLASVNNSDSPYYVLSDHLNSSSILTDSTGTVAQLSDYKPFGSINYDNKLIDLKNDYKYTGKELDEENNLQYYGARYMDNQTARFTSIDPVILRVVASVLNDPQSLNSYAYARNNPVILIDSDGNDWMPAMKGIVDGAWKGLKQSGQSMAAVAQNPSLIITSPVDLARQFYNDARYLAESYQNDPAGTTAQMKTAFSQLSKDWNNLSDEQKGQIVGYTLEKGAEAYVAGKVANKLSNTIKSVVPNKAYDVLNQIEKNDFKSAPQGYKGGKIFENRESLLPEKPYGYYKEWDVDPKPTIPGAGRNSERIVTGQGGEAWYTPDHYTETFIRINR